MKIKRRKTRRIYIGSVPIGHGAPIVVQSMTSTDTRDVEATVRQIRRLERAGCEIVRLGVPNREAARSLGAIKARAKVPLVADIHFDYRLALEALKQGVDGLRLNPGNIGSAEKVRAVTRARGRTTGPHQDRRQCGLPGEAAAPKYGGPTPEALVESALGHVAILEKEGFNLIKISLKASDVGRTLEAYRIISRKVDYPLHLGITEAGTLLPGAVKSSVGLGLLLAEGIGDTVRVSLTAAPEQEVRVAYHILGALGIRRRGVELISCPTCSRTQIDLIGLAKKVEKALSRIRTPLTVAVMGCVVNGPGEAREADVGIAGGRGKGLLFKKGKIVGRYTENELLAVLLQEVESMTGEKILRFKKSP